MGPPSNRQREINVHRATSHVATVTQDMCRKRITAEWRLGTK